MSEFGPGITNEELRRDDLPTRDHDQMKWIEFALTFDGYAQGGGFDKCEE